VASVTKRVHPLARESTSAVVARHIMRHVCDEAELGDHDAARSGCVGALPAHDHPAAGTEIELQLTELDHVGTRLAARRLIDRRFG
jgi:hypothetical protein